MLLCFVVLTQLNYMDCTCTDLHSYEMWVYGSMGKSRVRDRTTRPDLLINVATPMQHSVDEERIQVQFSPASVFLPAAAN